MTRALREAGFTLDALDEPQPDPAVRELDPDAWRSLTTEPRFIFLTATAAEAATNDAQGAKHR